MKIRRSNPFLGFFRHLLASSGIVLSMFVASASAQTLYWDTNADTAGSGNLGGNWDSDSYWSTDPAGATPTGSWIDGQNAVFSAGTDGVGAFTVTIAGTVTTPSILLKEAGGKTITGGTIEIGGGTLTASAAGNGNTVTIASALAGTGGITIAANGDTSDSGGGVGGRLHLSGTNTLSGDITITSGIVRANSSFGDAANRIVLNGGGLLDDNQNVNFTRNIHVEAGGGVYRTYGGVATGQITGAITGTGTFRRTDGGTLTLNCDLTDFEGILSNAQGTLVIGTPAATTMAHVPVVQRDGTNVLRLSAAGDTSILSLTSDRDVIVPFGSRLNIVNGTYTTVGAGTAYNGFWAQGTAAGNAAATGDITSSSGTLTVTNGSPTGNLTTTDNRIRLKITDFGSGPNPSLALVKNNNNSLGLDMVNTYTGGTTINGGRINADNVSALGTGTVTVNSGGQAALFAAGTFANNFVINGTGVTEAAGNLGAIRLNGNTLSGSVEVASAASIVAYSTSGTLSGPLTGSADLSLNLAGGPGTLNITGDASAYAGNITFNAGTLNIGSSGIGGGLTVSAGTANVTGGIAADLTTSGSITNVTGNIGGNVTSNAGLTTLNGGITGNVTVNGGRANLNGPVTGDVTVADLAKLGGEASIAGSLTLGGSTGSDLHVNAATPGALSAGTLNLAGTNLVLIDVLPTSPGAFTVLSYGTLASGDETNFEVPLGSFRGDPQVQHDVDNKRFTIEFDAQVRTWNNASLTGNWNTIDTNWDEGDNLFFSADDVVFTDTAAGTVNLANDLQPASITLQNTAGNDYTFAGGSLSGSTGITLSGGGNLTLGGTNAFTGPIQVSAGVLAMGSTQAFGLTSGITVASGASVDINGQTPGTLVTGGYTYTIQGTGVDGSGAIRNTGAAAFSNAGVKSLVLSGDATVNALNRFDIGLANVAGSGTITGNGFTLTKIGAGGVAMRGNAAGSPINYIAAEGDLWAENDDNAFGGATGSVSATGTARVGSYGTRTIATPVNLADGTSLINLGGGTATWTGAITLGGSATIVTDGNTALDGSLTGTGNITRNGGNILALQADASAFSGKFINNAGTLRLENANSLGTATGADALTLGGGTTLQGGTITALASTTVGSASQGITHSGTGTVFYDAGAGNTLTVASNISGGVTNLATQNGIVAFSGQIALNDPANTSANLVVRNNSTVSFLTGANASVRQINLGQNGQGNSSNMNLAEGATVTTTRLVTGDGGSVSTIINQTGGTLNITGSNNSNSTGASFLMGHWGGGTSVYNLSEGTLSAPNAMLSLGWDTTGSTFNLSGGTANLAGINLGNGRNNAAQFNLTGGRLNIGANGITNASNKQLNLGGGTVGAFGSWVGSKPATITGINGDTTFDTLDSVDGVTPRTITLTGPLANTSGAGLVKTGAGTLSLDSTTAGTFNGTATVLGGSLMLNANSLASGTVSVESGGTIQAGAVAATGTGNVAALTMDGGTAAFRVGATNDLLNVTNAGGLTVDTPSAIRALPAGPISGPFPVTYTVLDYTGTIGGALGFDGLSYSSANPHLTGTLVHDEVETRIQVQITAADTVVWKGNVNGNWDVNTTANWVLGSDGVTASNYYDFDVVSFGEEGIASPDVTLVGSITPATVTVSNDSGTYSFSGTGIGGSTSLTKSGTGGLTLLNENTYGGATNITGGTVTIGNGGTSGSLGGAGAINLATGAELVLNRSDAQTVGRTITGGGTLVSNGGNVTMNSAGNGCDIILNSGTFFARGGGWTSGLNPGRTITVNAPAILDTVTHSLGGLGVGGIRPAVMNLNEDAVWILNNEQYLPTSALNLTAANINGTGQLRGAGGPVVVNPHSTKSSIINAPVEFATGGVTFNVADGDVAIDLVVNGLIGGVNGSLVKSGDGTMVVTADNTFSAPVNIQAGTLQIGNGGETGTSGTGAITNNGSLVFNRSNDITLTSVISGTGTVTQNGTGKLTLDAPNAHTGATIVNSGTLALLGDSISDDAALVINGGIVEVTDVEVVASLEINGTPAAPGTYGATGSGADNIDDTRFAGTGMIEVPAPPPSGYNTWAAVNAPTGGPNDDFDGDGVANAIEFVLGGTKDTNDLGKLPTINASGENFVFSFVRDQSSKTAGTTVEIEVGTTLAAWPQVFDVATAPEVATVDNGNGTETITLTLAKGTDTTKFGRLKVGIE